MSERELRIERLIAATPEEVFEFWIRPELLVTWWGPEGCDIPEFTLEPETGKRWRTVMRMPDGKLNAVGGVWREIVAPRLLSFTWAWEDETGKSGHETEVSVTFAAAPGGTKLTLLQREFATAESTQAHLRGWMSTFACLDQVLKTKGAA